MTLHARQARFHRGLISTATLLTLWSGTCLADEITPHSQVPPILPQAIKEEIQFMQEEIVSIAVRHEQPISEAPSNVYVITAEDIRQSGAPELPTILRRIPGIEVMQMTGADFNVSVRGGNQPITNKLLVLVDGRSIYRDTQAQVSWKQIPVTLPEIRRIEVLKGPASALYGFNAFDGVINIITKSPEEMKGTTMQFGGGELGTVSSAAIHAGTYGNLSYRLSAGWDQNQQWRNRDALAFRAYKFNIQTEYRLPALSILKVSGGLMDASRFDGPITTITNSSGKPLETYVYMEYESPSFLLRGYWNGVERTTSGMTLPPLASILQTFDRTGSAVTDSFSNTYDVLAQYTLEFGNAHRMTSGVNYRHNTALTNFLDGFSREDRLGLYVQDEWKATKKLSAVAALRFDMDTFTNPTYSPRFSLLYKLLEKHTFRAAVSVAHRPPTLFETHLDVRTQVTLPGPFTITIRSKGSKDLDPERIISYELGYQGWFLRHRLRIRMDLFYNHLSDLIQFRTAASPTGPTSPANGGEGDIYGGEAGVEFLLAPWLSGFTNYAYQEIDQEFTGLSRRAGPQSKINGGLRVDLENGLNGEAAIQYVGPTTFPISAAFTNFAPLTGIPPPNPRVGSYTLLNLRGGYRFWKEKAELAVSVFNALNDKHKEHPLGETIGSRVMGWLTIKM